jgi:lipid-A-disaccharide synthase
MQQSLIILANSPGEMSGWVAPVVTQVRSILPEVHITVALIPDWFTSGREREFAAQLPVDRVAGVFTVIRSIWQDLDACRARRNLVLFLGGDALYAKGLAALLKCPAMAYMPRVYHPSDFRRIFVPTAAEKDRAVRKGADPDHIVVVPTLALDSVIPSGTPAEIKARFGLPEEARPIFSLMAGSRPSYVAMSIDFMLDIAGHLLDRHAAARTLLPVSPFIDRELVLSVLRRRGMVWTETPGGETLSTGPDGRILIVFAHSHDAFVVADAAVVLPGTNNLQCAALGVPFIMLMPLNSIEHIPFEGLLGFLYPKFFPFNKLKKYVISWLSKRIPYVSMVNRMAGRMLAPELRGVLTPVGVAEAVSDLWLDTPRREQLRADLLELTRERGAARIIAEAVRENFISD